MNPDETALLQRAVQLALDNAAAGQYHAVAIAAGATRIVYAAPRESIPDLGYPAPPDNDALMVQMQQALRSAAPHQVVYMPTEGAEEPFQRFLANRTPQ